MTTLIVLLLVRCKIVRKFPLFNRDIITKISRYNRNRDIKFNRDISLIAIYRGNTGGGCGMGVCPSRAERGSF